ncbi:hypothetical protein Sjap_017417 [Stephania japonica]|uniref:Aminotransferase class V domain-containing protein n=1 Tax=Stephania japonica TaxID=461633 RepID=A0AAP0NI96_9MAGN
MSDSDCPIVVIPNRKLITKLPSSDTKNVWNAIPPSPGFINSLGGIGEGDHSGDEDEERSTDDHAEGNLKGRDCNKAEVMFESVNNGIDRCEEKCSWLRSQIIGGDVEIATSFGMRRMTYADQTASGRCLQYVENFIAENVLPYYGNTHTEDSYVGHRMTKMVSKAAKYVKRCLGGGPEDALLFCGTGTTAAIKKLQEVMGITVPSTLRSRVITDLLRPEERWVVFVGPYEHHSNLLSWRESLADVVEIGADKDGLIDINMLRHELQSRKHLNRPMLGSFSACSNVTGICTDARAIARVLHEHGAFACFDFAASGPYVKIDIRSGELEGYDALFLSPHKFVGGPGTPGILLMSKALYKLSSAPPSTCGGGTVRFVNGFDKKDTLYFHDIEEREDAGTPGIIQKIRAALTFSVKEYMGYQLIEARENLWLQCAFKRLLPNPNIKILGDTSIKRHPILSFLIHTTSLDDDQEAHRDQVNCTRREEVVMKDKPLNCRFVTKLLNDLFGVQARGGCACAGPYAHFLLDINREHSAALHAAIQKGYDGVKPGWTRISFAYYMSNAEFEFILAAIEFIAQYGQRFLPLYHFNWKTGDWTFRKSAAKNILRDQELGLALDCLDLSSTPAFGAPPAGFSANCNSSSKSSSQQIKSGTSGNVELKYMTYLETAQCIAQSLPKFPPPCHIPKGIDPGLLLFKI